MFYSFLNTHRVNHRVNIGIAFTLAVAAAIGTTAFAVRRGTWFTVASESKTLERSVPGTVTPSQIPQTPVFAVNRAQLSHHVVRALEALGDRFESPGRARSILTGILTRHGESRAAPIAVIREFPDKLRLEEQTLSGLRVLGHDGTRSWAQTGSLSEEDAAFIEELVRDTVEHFVTGQAAGDATLHLGDMFRADDGSDTTYAGPFFDILRVDDTFHNSAGSASRPTLYYLNSRSGLPERIVYEQQSRGTAVKVEVEFSEWMAVASQKLPRRTVWRKDGAIVRELVISQAVFAPSAQDGILIAPAGR